MKEAKKMLRDLLKKMQTKKNEKSDVVLFLTQDNVNVYNNIQYTTGLKPNVDNAYTAVGLKPLPVMPGVTVAPPVTNLMI
jgi:hypothetical protein